MSEFEKYKDEDKTKFEDKIDKLESEVNGLTDAVEEDMERHEFVAEDEDETFSSATKEEHRRNYKGMMLKMATTLAMFGIALFVVVSITVFCICRVLRKRR